VIDGGVIASFVGRPPLPSSAGLDRAIISEAKTQERIAASNTDLKR
jgi:hypothetical protein